MTEPKPNPSLRRLLDGAFALIVASLVGSATTALAGGDMRIFPFLFIGALLFGTIFGLPAYVLARECKWDRPWTAALTGLLVAVMPTSCGALANSSEHAQVPWRELANFGLAGVLAGLVFWIVMKWPSLWAIGSPWLRTGLNGLATIAVLGAIYLVPHPPIDRSCHNPLRDGRTSIGASAAFVLQVDMDQWRAVAEELNDFGRAGRWSIRSDVRPSKEFSWFQVSLCKEPGTEISAGQFMASEISFFVMQPQGGQSWQPAFRALYQRMEARWPGRISFSDGNGNKTPIPDWAQGEAPAANSPRP